MAAIADTSSGWMFRVKLDLERTGECTGYEPSNIILKIIVNRWFRQLTATYLGMELQVSTLRVLPILVCHKMAFLLRHQHCSCMDIFHRIAQPSCDIHEGVLLLII